MEVSEKGKKPAAVSGLSAGLLEIAELPSVQGGQPKLIAPAPVQEAEKMLPPASPAKPQPERPKTQKEQELDALIVKRQEIIGQLKSKNPAVAEARRRIAEALPALRGKGASHTMQLVREAEHLEFLIATEADTPKKEKDMIKRLRAVNAEISKHKEIDEARKGVEAGRSELRSLLSDVKSLEHGLAQARKDCDGKYAEVLAERKAAYEQRQHRREERKERQFHDLRTRVREEKRRESDSDMAKYMKDYDDTVSMDEIVIIEKKDKKKEE